MCEVKQKDLDRISAKLDTILIVLQGDKLHPKGLISEQEKLKVQVDTISIMSGIQKVRLDGVIKECATTTKRVSYINKTIWTVGGAITALVTFIKFGLPFFTK